MFLGVMSALASALLYGVSDYFGATAARRIRVLPATTVSYVAATLVVAIALLFSSGAWVPSAVLWGAASGVCAIIGFLTFYAALASGSMSALSPLIALLGAAVPVAIALVIGQTLSFLGWLGVALAVCASVLISGYSGGRGSRAALKPLAFAVVAGTSFGFSIAALDLAPESSGLVPGFVELLMGLVLLTGLLCVARCAAPVRRIAALLDADVTVDARAPRRAAILRAGLGGALLGGANALLILALHAANLATVSVLISLYPLVTVVLATTLLKERLSVVQGTGVVLALVASALLATS